MATTTNYSWTTPDDTALVKDGAAAIRSLGTAIDTTVFNNASAAIAKTIVDAKGDIIAATAADTVARLAVGTDGQVLKANSATATGLEWATDASGMTNPMTTTGDTIYSSSGSTPARLAIGSTGNVLTVSGGVPTWAAPSSGSMTLLSTTTLSGSQIDLSSISQSYQKLILILKDVRVVSNGNRLRIRLNGITSTTYFNYTTFGVFEPIAPNDNVLYAGAGLNNSTDNDSLFQIEFPNYANTDTRKMMICTAITASASAPTTDNGGSMNWGANRSTSAISEINLLTNGSGFTSGTALLYGVN